MIVDTAMRFVNDDLLFLFRVMSLIVSALSFCLAESGASQMQGSENTAHLKGKLANLTETCR